MFFYSFDMWFYGYSRIIWLGDLNYRISLPEATTRLLVDGGDWSALLKNDQVEMGPVEQRSKYDCIYINIYAHIFVCGT